MFERLIPNNKLTSEDVIVLAVGSDVVISSTLNLIPCIK
jgi:hypothetical protein